MELNHHPSMSTLADFTLGTTSSIGDLVIQAHLSACEECREAVRDMESLGGELMMQGGHVTRKIDLGLRKEGLRICQEYENQSKDEDNATLSLSRVGDLEKGSELSDLFSTYLDCSFEALPWKKAGKNIRVCKLRSEGESSLWMIRGEPGAKLPAHSHGGQELTLILKGSYACSSQIYSKGDLHESDEEGAHQPIIIGSEECVSLVATEGKLKFEHWIPRLLQPLIGI